MQRAQPLASERDRVLAAAAAVTGTGGFGRVLGALAGCWGALDPLSLLPVTTGRLHSGGLEAMYAARDNGVCISDENER